MITGRLPALTKVAHGRFAIQLDLILSYIISSKGETNNATVFLAKRDLISNKKR
jgi:hypothetical protein